MKKIIPVPFLFVFTSFAVAQNVGIGTSTPVFKLDVRNGSINTDSVYRIGANTVLSTIGTSNLMIGRSTGIVNTGVFNTFCGILAGRDNTSGFDNSFFGASAGVFNTTGGSNSFFGTFCGDANTTGSHNSFFGKSSGTSTNTGNNNSFFGSNSGVANTTGSDNSFLVISQATGIVSVQTIVFSACWRAQVLTLAAQIHSWEVLPVFRIPPDRPIFL